MIGQLADMLQSQGPLVALGAVVLYLILRGEFTFRYPRRRPRR